jgi:hypothetical protein
MTFSKANKLIDSLITQCEGQANFKRVGRSAKGRGGTSFFPSASRSLILW